MTAIETPGGQEKELALYLVAKKVSTEQQAGQKPRKKSHPHAAGSRQTGRRRHRRGWERGPNTDRQADVGTDGDGSEDRILHQSTRIAYMDRCRDIYNKP